MTKNKKVIKAVATVTVFSVFTRALSFLFKIYLSRTLGAEVVGLYQICISIFYLFAALSASGLPVVLSRKTSENRALKKNENFSLLSSALFIGIILSITIVIILTLAKPLLPYILSDPKTIPLFIIMFPAIISTTIYGIIRGWFWGKKKFLAFSITETVEEVFRILFSVLFVSGVISGISGAYGVALAFTVSDFFVALILIIMFFAKGGKISKPSKIKEIFLPAIPITAMRVFGCLIATFTAVILPARLVASGLTVPEATASFGRIAGMANPLILAPNAIISSLAIVLVPEMSETGIKKNYSALNKHINNGISFSLFISGTFLLCYYALGEEITTLLFHDSISGVYLQWATFLMLPICISQMTMSALNSIGLEGRTFLNYICGTVFMMLGIYFLPKYMGIYSVIVATMLSLLTSSILNLLMLHKKTSFHLYFIKDLVKVIVFILPSSFFASSLNGLIAGKSAIVGLILGCMGGIIMYISLLIITDTIDVKGFIKLKTSPKIISL